MSDSQTPNPNSSAQPDAPAEKPLTFWEKAGAGFLLIFFFILALITIIALWPNKIKPLKSTSYKLEAFNVTLDTSKNIVNKPPITDAVTTPKVQTAGAKPLTATQKDSLQKDSIAKSAAKKKATTDEKKDQAESPAVTEKKYCTIELSSLLLIMVAAAGFLGNMVHIATSFTTFVGADQFKRSWLLWYVVKPFTASGLALFLYFALSPDPNTVSTINLNMIMAGATLAGLFTDKATQKLKDIFDAAFKGSEKDERPDKLVPAVKEMSIDLDKVQPATIAPGVAVDVQIPGQNLNKDNLVVTMDAITVTNLEVNETLIKFQYTAPAGKPAGAAFDLKVADKTGKALGEKAIPQA